VVGRQRGRGHVRAIVSIVIKWSGSPCRRTSVTVSVVPVDGAQVMLNGTPAVIEVRLVNVKEFCALERAARAAMRRVVGRCIVIAGRSLLLSFLFLPTDPFSLSR